MSSGTDYNSDGFNQGDDGTVFGDPGSDPGSVSDYDTWDWKQIEAAINGMSAGVDDSSNQSHAESVSDPNSLQTAANAFYSVQQTLSMIAQSLSDQAAALAGPNGPWTGDAADSFVDMINTFSKQVTAAANVLSGGSGTHSVPQQLADNAVNLQNAQTKISEIDSWYANQATLMGVKPMSNGLIPISQKPQLVQMMTDDMRAVLKSLAGEYQVTIDAVRSPEPITSPGDNPPTDTNDPNDPDSADDEPGMLDQGALADPGLSPDTSPAPFPLSDSTDGAGDPMSPDAFDSAAGLDPGGLNPTGLDPAALDRALNPDADSALADPAAFPGGTGVGGPDDGTGGLDDGGLPLGGITPSAFKGGTGTGGTGSLPLGDELAADPDTWSDTLPADFPGSTSTGGVGSLGTDDGLGASDGLGAGDGLGSGLGDPAAFPGGLSTESGLPDGLSGAAFPGGTDTAGSGADGGMPYLPGMGGSGASGAGAGGERSDASGLLDSNGEPWAGSPDTGDEVGSPLGTDAGGEGLGGLPLGESGTAFPGGTDTGGSAESAGDGMPYLPGMGGSGAPGAGASGERSDASGLLDNEGEPWTGLPDAGDEVGSPLGADAGGEGLGLPLDGEGEGELPTATGAEGAEGAGDGMPYLPGTGGSGAPGADTSGERSDASGLLDSNGEPWTGLPDAGEEVGSPLGAETGGVGLAFPFPEGGTVTTAEPSGEDGGMPFLPGSGAGGSRAESAAERSDASGLLDTDDDAWTGEIDAPDGAVTLNSPDHPGSELAAPEAALGEVFLLLPPAVEEPAGETATALESFPEEEDEEEAPLLADDRVAVIVQDSEGEHEETSAWDLAGEALVPLLWGLSGEDEREVRVTGYGTEEDETWSEYGSAATTPGTALRTEPDEDAPAWATWRPNRTPLSGSSGGGPGSAFPVGAPLSCAAGSFEELEEEPAADEDEPEEAGVARSIADLLVQDGDTWGSAGGADDRAAF